ncbi:hypothetical protein PVAP13_5KG493121 [Panicum virgatum]|uniref:Uncharacterized protein n=1 Tax=Panicum virgatum TaxID=38727 RepID=A0A8T0SSG4_PANVG|nr:hypothetical protein PVAP13_5KG493121 [Panicum virgatum]
MGPSEGRRRARQRRAPSHRRWWMALVAVALRVGGFVGELVVAVALRCVAPPSDFWWFRLWTLEGGHLPTSGQVPEPRRARIRTGQDPLVGNGTCRVLLARSFGRDSLRVGSILHIR